ncbi:phosphatidylinositol-glycan biosynthesis class F protein [Favolaschia claudopus]|uniref:Phosphatidylinositol-glycan biosynthesis class F protein n=1 Tax=Favolaschia claudopus TaxID=2862362 RepID=A0AAW0CUD1_9AGAR
MPKNTKTRKPPSQKTEDPSNPPPPTYYFPFAGYTSAVGVHTTLLAFSALFLPRTSHLVDFIKLNIDPSQITSKDRPQHPFLDDLTLSPTSTLAWLCVGAIVLQSWWGGWIRSWWVESALQSTGIERRVDRTRIDARKYSNLLNAWLATGATSLVLHFVLILFGAPLLIHVWKTYLLALLVSVLVVFPPAYTIGVPIGSVLTWMTWVRIFAEFSLRTPVERAMLYPAFGTVVGCWIGVIPIALDWDRPWQAWPLTPALGAILGYILSSIAALTANALSFLADEHLRSAAKIKTN